MMGERLIQEAVEHLRAAHVPEYRFPERAASALAVLVQRSEYLARSVDVLPQHIVVDSQFAQDVLGACLPDGFLPQEAVERLMQIYGIPTPPLRLATSARQAVQIAR